ncbi:unnamed protein product [Cylicocyclus nassatus]|uniref:RRM domain-containing protein n=1 Tax=Cylicocyclus nassatus TaxID=53992 RepID=A0AA36MD80_CYLNA|nr:unnamed protein product [Cylicocyclus nassatus]
MSKRGPEELLSSIHGTILAPVMTVDSEPKKAKLDPTALYTQYISQMNGLTTAQLLAGQPLAQIASAPNTHCTATSSSTPRSRVVHIRNIPPDMVDVELIQLCVPYGPLSNYMMLKGKSQAFVEYEDEHSAVGFVTSMNAVPIQIRGRTIFAQYSTHQELRLDKNRSSQETGADGLPISNGSSISTLDISGGTQQAPNSVLRVIIENMIYPVTLDVLHTLFSRYGKVLRIITFNKNNTFQALVQISEANAAQLAKQNLENQNVYNGCCTLRIDYSKLSTLNVKYNNDKSRDYTNPNLPSGEISLEQQLGLGIPGLQSLLPTASPYSFAFGANPATTFIPPTLGADATALSQYLPSLGALSGAVGGLTPSSLTSLRFPVNILSITSVVLVSNLDENKVSPDALFTLFGVYGDVVRVKILYNKKDNALIQYSEPQQAQLAMQHLDKIRWHDRVIRVAPSKHNNVQLPKEGQPDAGLTRDYSHSPLHRFKKPGSKNYMNIYPPSCTLHLSNIPPNISEETLTEAFEQNGFQVKAFKFFPKDHKMALCQLEDVETAIDALIAMHNHKLAENAHLRVSFSKSGI